MSLEKESLRRLQHQEARICHATFDAALSGCEIMGYHRDTFYEVRRAFQVGGVAALVEQKRGLRGPHPNRVAPEIEERILALCLEHPTYGAQRTANELRLQGVDVSPSGVRGIWMRHVEANAPGELLNQDTFY